MKKLRPPRKCLVPDVLQSQCNGKPIDSHTVSRSGSLGAISKDGHVYSYKTSLQALTMSLGEIRPTLTGWKQASTFPGFCGTHDKQLFAPLEDHPFTGTAEQCFLLAYRALNSEFHAKFGSHLQTPFRQALTSGNEMARELSDMFGLGVEAGLRDAQRHKKRYDEVLISKKWDLVRYEIFEFNGIFPIQCAAAIFPERDVYGNSIQQLGLDNKNLDVICINSFAADGKSYFSLCWLEDSHASCEKFVAALNTVKSEDLPMVLATFILQSSENCHLSPKWYDALPSEGKIWCRDHMMNGVFDALPPPYDSVALPYISGQFAHVKRTASQV